MADADAVKAKLSKRDARQSWIDSESYSHAIGEPHDGMIGITDLVPENDLNPIVHLIIVNYLTDAVQL
ncbi:MAG: hypothetical protein HIU91_08030 [Acidobacteria bacterium]|nr:hypothetical protein [Acidobacteriota bacterium]